LVKDFLDNNVTILQHPAYYPDVLCRIRSAVRKKRKEIWRTNSYYLLHDNVSPHRLNVVKDVLAKNNVTALKHFLCSPNLADFYLLPRLILALE
jgi:hypothetical protein